MTLLLFPDITFFPFLVYEGFPHRLVLPRLGVRKSRGRLFNQIYLKVVPFK